MQSSLDHERKPHVAIIMDGNGRWATARGLPRAMGHREGVKAVRRVAEAAGELGVGTLSLYAFSSDNWRRPREEVDALMGLLLSYLQTETRRLAERGVRLTVFGRRDRLSHPIQDAILAAEVSTAMNQGLHLRIALDYSSRDAIARAAASLPRDGITRESLSRALARTGDGAGDIDLLVRTSGEQRLSDFMLWEAAYAELLFTDTLWPDFDAVDLGRALDEFRSRDRRFGGLPAPPDPLVAAA